MSALIGKKQPSQFTVHDLFTHAHQFIGVEGEIWGILVRAPVDGLFRW
jgi:hypothetical protein